ncbi:MAG: translation initiation factor IF-2 [Candidatus Aminicenantes bacterium]|nr:MAG: translation initiation factor IF-2 [Candidatus Aminicenantes bacterium]
MEAKEKKKKEEPKTKTSKSTSKKITLREGGTLKELSEKTEIKFKDLLETLRPKRHSISVNDMVDESLAELISKEFKLNLEIVSIEKEIRTQAESHPKEMILRHPVVTIMGHVDHGKTTLLDAIRESNLVGKESGGITQHIGAYRIFHANRPITFIDTPGHEAFTQLRARGAKLTDIVVLVVAADDGVMPQTVEAIHHAKDANVPIIVVINKIDKKNADIDKAKQQLSKEGLLVEDWGGKTISVEVSAKEKTNLDELLEMILLLGDVIEIKANPKVQAQGIVLEAGLDAKKGAVATVIMQHGILSQREAFICGTCYGKARALFDEKGKPLKKAEPSMPVEVLGFSDVPVAGDYFQVVSDLETAKQIAQYRLSQVKKTEAPRPEHLTLDELFKKMEEGEIKELPLIMKTDVHGSVEVLSDILPNLSTDQIKIKIVHSATGKITESDVHLATASNAIIIGYNIKPDQKILDLAKKESVEIRIYKVIYELTKDIKKAVAGMLEPILKETHLGNAEVRRIFSISRIGVIAGCYVTDGIITRNAEARVLRADEEVYKGRISSLKHLKENVTEVKKDYECGIRLDKFKEFQEGDIIEAFVIEKEIPK